MPKVNNAGSDDAKIKVTPNLEMVDIGSDFT